MTCPLATARERLAHVLAELSAEETGALLRIRAESLDWLAGVLASLGCGFEIRRPEELRAAVHRLAGRLASVSGGLRDIPPGGAAVRSPHSLVTRVTCTPRGAGGCWGPLRPGDQEVDHAERRATTLGALLVTLARPLDPPRRRPGRRKSGRRLRGVGDRPVEALRG